ncbi:MAG: ATP-binding protein [Spirochaetia bacterium]|nr:ATP-binding protein [Spirochaetia bacterium]
MNKFAEELMSKKALKILEVLHLECPKHGPYTNNRILRTLSDGSTEELPLSGCPECRYDQDRLAIANMLQTNQFAKQIADAQIPAKFKDCMVRNFCTKDLDSVSSAAKVHARDMALTFIQDSVRSLVLLGGTDRGKSHLLAAMLKGCIQTGRTALYVLERKIYRDIHESYQGRKDLLTEGQVIDLYSKVDVLGIDELGRSSWTEHEAQILYEIIDKRDCENRKTVMAGNLMPDEFKAKFDDSFRRKLGAAEVVCRWNKWEEIA